MKYEIEDLQYEGLKIYQTKQGYRFTSDAVILANIVKAKPDDKVVEFCSGSGVISILIAKKLMLKNIYAFECQKSLFDMSSESVKLNNLTNKIHIINDNIQNYINHFEYEKFDVVVCNPPYYPTTNGLKNQNEEISVAKSEINLTLEEFIITTAKALKFGGTLYFSHNPSRLFEIFLCLNKYNLTPKEIIFSQANPNSEPSCVFIKAQKGAKTNLRVHPNIITHNNSQFISTIKNLFSNK